MQFIKGGFSFRAKKELGSNAEIWQRGFSDHRIRDAEDYEQHLQYIRLNPVKKHCGHAALRYSVLIGISGWKLDPLPQGLKPRDLWKSLAARLKPCPFKARTRNEAAESLTEVLLPARLKPCPFTSNAKNHDVQLKLFSRHA